jgi:hypothetical protein
MHSLNDQFITSSNAVMLGFKMHRRSSNVHVHQDIGLQHLISQLMVPFSRLPAAICVGRENGNPVAVL